MKFLADENFPFPSIVILREAGFSVKSVAELYPGLSDHEVVGKAKIDDSIILTFDKDYGEIIFKHGSHDPPAIVIFRFKGENPEASGKILRDLMENKKINFERNFTVIEKEGIRQRKY